MWIRLRQIAIVAADLQRAATQIGTVLGLEACFTDPGVKVFGLKNTLWPIGTQMIEVVTPTKPDTAAGRYLQRRGGDGGYMVINQVDDIERRRARANELGVRVAFDLHFPDEGHDGIQLHPGDTGGSFFEMDQMLGPNGNEPGGPWYPAGPNWEPYVRTERVSGISAAELQSPEPERLARRWAEIAELDMTHDPNGYPTIDFENAALRFVPDRDGRGEGLGGIDVTTNDRDAVLDAADRHGCAVDAEEDCVELVGVRVFLR